jgi:hypothetical protein
VPAITYLILIRIIEEKPTIKPFLLAIAIGTILLGAFYIPFMLNPNFSRTIQYLLNDRVGTGGDTSGFQWGGATVWLMSTLYNSTYYIILLITLTTIGFWHAIKQRRYWSLIIYFLTAFIFYLFVVVDPRTHVYTIFPPVTLLAGLGFSKIWRALPERKWVKMPAFLLTTTLLLLCANYPYQLFIQHTPEWQRTGQTPPLYWHTWDNIPEFGLFGFPYRAGWRNVPAFLPPDSTYASNEEE